MQPIIIHRMCNLPSKLPIPLLASPSVQTITCSVNDNTTCHFSYHKWYAHTIIIIVSFKRELLLISIGENIHGMLKKLLYKWVLHTQNPLFWMIHWWSNSEIIFMSQLFSSLKVSHYSNYGTIIMAIPWIQEHVWQAQQIPVELLPVQFALLLQCYTSIIILIIIII